MSTEQMPRSILMVIDERARQVVEKGFDTAHDQEHQDGELASAGGTYVLPHKDRTFVWDPGEHDPNTKVPLTWPWLEEFWKPTPDDRIRELVKGAALIVAEIDRLLLEQVPDDADLEVLDA